MYGKIFLTLSSILIVFFLLEIVSRSIVPLASPYHLKDGRLIWDNRGFWLNQPNQSQHYSNIVDFNKKRMRTDGSGLRYVPCRKDINPQFPRIYVVGDSQTFGYGVNDQETWVNQLQCLMTKNKIQFSVFNLGVPGTNIDQYIARTKMIYDIIRKHDIVIYLITWNDFHTHYTKIRQFKDQTGCATIKANYPILCSPNQFKYDHNKDTWRRNLYESTGLFIPLFSSLKQFMSTVVYTSSIASIMIPIVKGLYIKFRRTNTMEKLGPRIINANIKLINILDSIVKKKTNNVLFAFLPGRLSYVKELYELYSKNGKVFPERDFLWYFYRKQCSKHLLNCFSLFQALQTDRVGVYDYSHDGHLNGKGSEKVANAVFNYILSNTQIRTDTLR